MQGTPGESVHFRLCTWFSFCCISGWLLGKYEKGIDSGPSLAHQFFILYVIFFSFPSSLTNWKEGFEILQLLRFLRIGCHVLYVGFFFNLSTTRVLVKIQTKCAFCDGMEYWCLVY